jgi:hypothetical protein
MQFDRHMIHPLQLKEASWGLIAKSKTSLNV